MKKLQLFFATVLMISLCGCGYTFGPLGHPQLETVAVAPVINDTTSYNASAVLRGLLTERFTTDGTMKLTTSQKADCIVYARIVDVKYQAVGHGTLPNGDDTFLANEWRCQVTVEYSVILPGRGKPLIHNQKVNGESTFLNGPDMENSRSNALRQSLFAASKNIVANITEGW